jgi:hypothetical protein
VSSSPNVVLPLPMYYLLATNKVYMALGIDFITGSAIVADEPMVIVYFSKYVIYSGVGFSFASKIDIADFDI